MNISEIGKFALLEKLNAKFDTKQKTTAKTNDDCSVITSGANSKEISSRVFLEGINFNLIYTPLKHLGYKVVSHVVSDIIAMNAVPQQILVSVGLSSRFNVSDVETFYDGIYAACQIYNIDVAKNDITASLTGMVINITGVGETDKDNICCRDGAEDTNLICITGDLGAAYMGLQVLERERFVFENNPNAQPQLSNYNYILQKQLRPEACIGMIDVFRENGIKPTSMINVSDGLASEILHICRQSDKGARIYIDKIPIASETFKTCEEMNIDPVTAALNGGDDLQLLFTIALSEHEKIKNLSGFEVIGHITNPSKGAYIVTPDGTEIKIKAQGWAAMNG